jgi:sialic acid synthase SpsE
MYGHREGKEVTRVIAEIGVNHMGDVAIARQLVEDAAKGGAWGVKVQLYVPELLDARKEKQAELRKWMLTKRELLALRRLAGASGLAFGASCFDNPSVELLKSLAPDFQKTACGQEWPGMKRLPVLQFQSYTRTVGIRDCIFRGAGIVPFLCVPKYPAHIKDYWPIPAWARGISDHTIGHYGGALGRGLEYVEVHIGNRADCPDAAVSIRSNALSVYVAIANEKPEDYEPVPRTRVVLKRPIKGQRVAWLRGV